jgi:bifunctional UDP-N-acetylglucosamine pyrophosphorylase / glucosamine-1-phosphate N-acetyltransferase
MSPLYINSRKSPVNVLVLAAGLGTRMKSGIAKVLHQLDGRPLIAHVCRTAAKLEPRKIYVVVGHQAQQVQAAVADELGKDGAEFVVQVEQRGTGDAVMAAKSALAESGSTIVVLSGDVPLIRDQTLGNLLTTHDKDGAACTILTVRMENPMGYGRIVRDDQNAFHKIVEQKDASEVERQIREVNSGIYCFDSTKLFRALEQVRPANSQGEYYLTDVPAILRTHNERVSLCQHPDVREVSGINTRAELAEFENLVRRRTIRRLMLDEGVTFIDPAHSYISSEARIGRDCVIHPDVHIEGRCVIGEACQILHGARIVNSTLGNRVTVKDHSVINTSTIEDDCSVGPFAHLRMEVHMHERAAIGNFVEAKKTTIGRGTKSMHLTYLGDATIGDKTNIGAGTITCNYDGKHKHSTIIEDNVKIGSDTMLVAPVRVGKGSMTAAGAVVTEDVPPGTLVAGVPAKVKKKLTQD